MPPESREFSGLGGHQKQSFHVSNSRYSETTPPPDPEPGPLHSWQKPSSRAAFPFATHIFLRVIRTASSATRGSPPHTRLHAVLAAPAAKARPYGKLQSRRRETGGRDLNRFVARPYRSVPARTVKRPRIAEVSLWRFGLAAVSLATIISVLPLIIHYIGKGPTLSSSNLLTAHFTSAASFAVLAGVMLARSRGRDRARQRARDLTLALSTMFAYAAQIQDPQERARFTYDMGRVVIESFLRGDGAGDHDNSTSIISALLAKT